MFIGPLEATKPWSMRVEGVFRFLNRVWRLIADERPRDRSGRRVVDDPPDRDTARWLHRTIRR